MYRVLSSLILSLVRWIVSDLGLMARYSDLITSCLVRVGLVTTGPRAIRLRVQSWWTRYWMWFVRKLRDVTVAKASN